MAGPPSMAAWSAGRRRAIPRSRRRSSPEAMRGTRGIPRPSTTRSGAGRVAIGGPARASGRTGPSGPARSTGEARAMATKWHRAGLTRAIPVPRNRAASGFLMAGTARMNSASRPRAVRPRRRALDIGLLGLADRAALRLLHRILITTPDQLATLVYSSRRTAYRHLARLARLDLVEVVPLPPRRGGVPFAYRLTGKALRRLGYTEARISGFAHMRHALDCVEAVCALVRAARTEQVPTSVELWLPESTAGDAGLLPARPDGVVVLQRARLLGSRVPGDRRGVGARASDPRQARHLGDGLRGSTGARAPVRRSDREPPRLAAPQCRSRNGALPSKVGRSASWPATSPPRVSKHRSHPSAGAANARPLARSSPSLGRGAPGLQSARHAWVELLGSGGGEDVDRVLFDSPQGTRIGSEMRDDPATRRDHRGDGLRIAPGARRPGGRSRGTISCLTRIGLRFRARGDDRA